MSGLPDALDTVRAAFALNTQDPLAQVAYTRGEERVPLEQATDIVVSGLDPATLHAQEGKSIAFPKDTVTRLARSKESAAQNASPEASPELFFTLAALVFAVDQRNERAGAYLRNATTAQVPALYALDRQGILDYLLGKSAQWDGVVGAAHGAEGATHAATPAGPAKRVYVRDEQDAEWVKRVRNNYEVVLVDRDDALKGTLCGAGEQPGPVTDLRSIRSVVFPMLDAAKRRASGSSRTPQKQASGPARKTRAQDPIILLSNSPTALINMFNVRALLQDGVFVPPEEARKQAGGIPELVVTIQSRSSDAPNRPQGRARRVLVVDSAEAVNRLGTGAPGSEQDPWNRVIAVFTTGQLWQFKNYRWTDPRDLFRNAMGVYARWNNDTPSAQLRDWSVTELQIDRTKRHTDKQLAAFFWRTLDGWVQRKKPHLQA